MKHRILYVSTSTTVGGAEKTLYTLATLVDPSAFDVVGVVSVKPLGAYGHKLEKAGTAVCSLDVPARAGIGDIQRLAVVIQQTKPDLVHAVMYQAIQLCRAVCRLGYAEFKLVSSPRVNYRTRGSFSLLIDGFLKKADDLLIAECQSSQRHLVQELGYPADRTMTIYNGVEIAGWSPSKAERAALRKKLGVKDNQILIGAVGRLDEQKGHIYLLEAMAKLKTLHPVKCIIIGDGPLRDKLKEMIVELGLKGTVGLLGEQPNIPAWLSALDIFALPSLWEGLPNALLEAMALGLPVVASKVDGVAEAVRHDVSGILCAPKDSQALYVPLQDLVVDPNLRAQLGEGAKKLINEKFQLSGMIHQYEEAYKRVIAGEEE